MTIDAQLHSSLTALTTLALYSLVVTHTIIIDHAQRLCCWHKLNLAYCLIFCISQVQQLFKQFSSKKTTENNNFNHFPWFQLRTYITWCYHNVQRYPPELTSVHGDDFHCRSMKGKLLATYPDAFPDSSTTMILDQRPDLERPLE